MTVATVPPPQTVQPKPDAPGNSPRDPRRDGSGQGRERQPQEREARHPFLNVYGEVTGMTINITA